MQWAIQSQGWICLGLSWAFMWFLWPPWHMVFRAAHGPSQPAFEASFPLFCQSYATQSSLGYSHFWLCSRSRFHQGCPSTRPPNSSGSSSRRSSDVENPSLAGSTLFYCYLIPCCPHMVNFRLMEDKKLVFSIIYLVLPYCLCLHIFNSQESAWCIKAYHTL